MRIFIEKNLLSNLNFGIFTGDNCPHDIWNQSSIKNVDNTELITNILKKLPDF